MNEVSVKLGNNLIKGISLAVLTAVSYVGMTAVLNLYFGNASNTGIGAIFIFAALIFILYKCLFKEDSVNFYPVDLIFSLFAGIALIVGKTVYETEGIFWIADNIFKSIYLALGLSVYMLAGLSLLRRLYFKIIEKINSSKPVRIEDKKRRIIIASGFVILFIVYLRCYLAYYPGLFSYDSMSHTNQALGEDPIDNHHPVILTLFWKFLLWFGPKLGSSNPFAIYTFIQMSAVLALYCYVFSWQMRKNYSRVITALTYLYFLLVPTFHIMPLAFTKDVYFTCCLVMYFISIDNLQEKFSKKGFALTCLWGLLCVLLRNNMLYVVVGALLVSLIMAIKMPLKSVCIQFAVVLAAGLCVFKIIYPLAGVSQQDRGTESLAVPITQVCYVYINDLDKLSEEDKDDVESFVGDIYAFNSRYVDFVKDTIDDNYFNEHEDEFWDVYFRLFKIDPLGYISAFLNLNINLWYPNCEYPDPIYQKGYIETFWYPDSIFPIERESKNETLLEWYETIAYFTNGYMRIPLVYSFFSLSFSACTLYFGIYLALIGKRRKAAPMYAMLVFLLASYIVGPVAIFRYMYTFYIALPIYFGALFHKEKSEEELSEEEEEINYITVSI